MASIKKHVNQMTSGEKNFLFNKLKSIKEWHMSKHLRKRMEERGGSMDKLKEVFEHGELIEYHQKDGVSRVLLRGNKSYNKSVYCVVFQFKEAKIITLYFNDKNDHHSTLREEAYDESVDIMSLFHRERIK